MGRDSIAIVPTAPVRLRNNDVEYAYRPDSDFYYLTGFNEPESVAVLIPHRPQGEYILFVRDRDPARETWDGRRAGPEGATRDFGADHAFPITDIDEILPGLLENRAKVFYAMGTHPEFDQRVVGWVNGLRTQARNGRHPPQEIVRARSCAARHAPVQEPRRSGDHARGRPHRRACPCARHACLRAGQTRVRDRRGAGARVPGAQRGPVLPADRRGRCRTAASCTTAKTMRRCATATCCSSTRVARSTATPRTSRARFPSTGVFRPSSSRSMKSCSRRITPPSIASSPAITGTSRTRPRCA